MVKDESPRLSCTCLYYYDSHQLTQILCPASLHCFLTHYETAIISMLGNGDSCHKIAARLDVGHSIVHEQCSQIASTLPKSVGGHS